MKLFQTGRKQSWTEHSSLGGSGLKMEYKLQLLYLPLASTSLPSLWPQILQSLREFYQNHKQDTKFSKIHRSQSLALKNTALPFLNDYSLNCRFVVCLVGVFFSYNWTLVQKISLIRKLWPVKKWRRATEKQEVQEKRSKSVPKHFIKKPVA